jgi:hypothetical protein
MPLMERIAADSDAVNALGESPPAFNQGNGE